MEDRPIVTIVLVASSHPIQQLPLSVKAAQEDGSRTLAHSRHAKHVSLVPSNPMRRQRTALVVRQEDILDPFNQKFVSIVMLDFFKRNQHKCFAFLAW